MISGSQAAEQQCCSHPSGIGWAKKAFRRYDRIVASAAIAGTVRFFRTYGPALVADHRAPAKTDYFS
jgi:hypothetical protein